MKTLDVLEPEHRPAPAAAFGDRDEGKRAVGEERGPRSVAGVHPYVGEKRSHELDAKPGSRGAG